jgi:hypothetical protein
LAFIWDCYAVAVVRFASQVGELARRDLRRDTAGLVGALRRRSAARVNERVVRLVGKIPLQGRQGTRRLIRLCHDADDAISAGGAWAELRWAAAMNVVRHILPLPIGVVATVTYRDLNAHHASVLLLIAEGSSVLLTLLSAAAAYAQAAIHLSGRIR